jgi:hypothetical protein
MEKQKNARDQEKSKPAFTPEELDAIAEEATIDAYGIDEELGSWAAYLEDELSFPFPVLVIGNLVQATGVEERGDMVKLRVKSAGANHWINLTDCEVVNVARDTSRNGLLLAAYRNWFSPSDDALEYEEI